MARPIKIVSMLVLVLLLAFWLLYEPDPTADAKTIGPAIKLQSPIVQVRVTGRFNDPRGGGYLHNGVDLAAPIGTAVMAPADGVISAINKTVAGGNQLFIKHTNGWISGFAHLDSYVAKKGQSVKRGELVARVGNTGRSTGPHLHWTLTIDGVKVDPLKYI